jgi:DNA-binding MarR family transcriptional regulator
MATEAELSAAYEIWGLSAIVTKIARRDLEERLALREAGVRAVEHGVLRNLQEERRTLAYLSRAMGMAPSSLVPVIDGLEAKGLVGRGRDPKDRRSSPVSLTKEGEELLARTPAMDAGSVLVKGLGDMSEEQRQQLLLSLRSFVSHLTDEEKGPEGQAEATGQIRLQNQGGASR